MSVEDAVRAMAGSVILLSLALNYLVSPYWLFVTVFVGLNLLQSSMTKFCPAAMIFKKLGVGAKKS